MYKNPAFWTLSDLENKEENYISDNYTKSNIKNVYKIYGCLLFQSIYHLRGLC